LDHVKQEINFQDKIINEQLYKNFEINIAVNDVINNIISNMTNRSLELECFERLEEIGEVGVPYIISALNDFRELPIKNISLRNYSKDAFEGIRHYGPHLVVDALTAILNQITGESFGFIYNGKDTTNEERERSIRGWYIYLYYLSNEK
jgi:hypothetical protein